MVMDPKKFNELNKEAVQLNEALLGISATMNEVAQRAARATGDTESGNGDTECQNRNISTNSETTGITIDNVEVADTNASIINDSGQLNVANLPPYRALYYIIRIK